MGLCCFVDKYSSFCTCTMQQLHAGKTQPHSQDKSCQGCLVTLQRQDREGFRLPHVIWLGQCSPVATLLGQGEREALESLKRSTAGGKRVLHWKNSINLPHNQPSECPESGGEVDFLVCCKPDTLTSPVFGLMTFR